MNLGGQPGADVQPHAVVNVRLPADGLFVQWLPADKDVVRLFASQDFFEFGFEVRGRGQPSVGTFLAGSDFVGLALDPAPR